MPDIRILRDQRADLFARSDAIYKGAEAAGKWTDDATASYDALGAEIDGVDAAIRREETQMNRQRQQGVITDPAAGGVPNAAGPQKFASFAEQLQAVARAEKGGFVDPRLVGERSNGTIIQAGATGMSESIGPDGGFLVQTDFAGTLMQNMWDQGEITSRIRRITVGPNSNGITMNGIDEVSRANGSRWGGVQSFWTAEAGLKTASQPRFKKIKMELDKLTALVYATDELLQDTDALQSYLSQVVQDEMDFRVEDAIINGAGAGAPLGILNSGALITVAKDTSQASGTLLSSNFAKMWARLPPRSRANAVWLINSDVEPLLWALYMPIKNVAGTENVGGIATPIVFSPPGTNGNQYGTLMGRPVIPVEYCAALNTPGDIILADLSQYLGIDKGGMTTDSSIHVRFIYDETVFRFVYRFNGQPIFTTPVTPYRGNTIQSPFVVLGSR